MRGNYTQECNGSRNINYNYTKIFFIIQLFRFLYMELVLKLCVLKTVLRNISSYKRRVIDRSRTSLVMRLGPSPFDRSYCKYKESSRRYISKTWPSACLSGFRGLQDKESNISILVKMTFCFGHKLLVYYYVWSVRLKSFTIIIFTLTFPPFLTGQHTYLFALLVTVRQ